MKKRIIFYFLLIIFLTIYCARVKQEKKYSEKFDIERLKENTIRETLETEKRRENFQLEIFGSYEGILSDDIKDIDIEKDNVYLCYNSGITFIDKKEGKILNFPYTNKECNFNAIKIKEGFIYIGAKDGLYRFNIEKKSYQTVSSNIEVIQDLVEYNGDIIFASSDGTIYLLKEGNIVTITNINENIYLIKEFNENIFVIATNSIYKMNPDTHKYLNLVSLSNIKIKDFCVVEDDVYLADNNLIKYNFKTKEFTKILEFAGKVYITSLLYSDEREGIYIGTSRGLGFYDLIKGEYHFLLTQHKVKDAYINCIEEQENILWLGTREFGIVKYTLSGDGAKLY